MIHPIRHRKGLILAACCAVLIWPASERSVKPTGTLVARVEAGGKAAQERIARRRAYGQLPLNFEANIGQVRQGSNAVKFLSRGAGYALFLTSDEAVLALRGREESVLLMKLEGANLQAKVAGAEALPGKSNYLIGNDPREWRTSVPTYAKVKYENVYPGVDLVYYGNQGQLEYDFVVAPGADPKAITLNVAAGLSRHGKNGGVKPPLRIDRNGNLVVKISGDEVRFHKPFVYQPSRTPNPESRTPIEGRYRLAGQQVTFSVGSYDRTKPLVIDPALSYSTYLGGSGADAGFGITVDSSGNAYVAGGTCSTDFPIVPGAFQSTYGGSTFCSFGSYGDAVVTKFNPAGSALV